MPRFPPSKTLPAHPSDVGDDKIGKNKSLMHNVDLMVFLNIRLHAIHIQ